MIRPKTERQTTAMMMTLQNELSKEKMKQTTNIHGFNTKKKKKQILICICYNLHK